MSDFWECAFHYDRGQRKWSDIWLNREIKCLEETPTVQLSSTSLWLDVVFSLLSCCSAFVQHRCFHQTLFVLLWDLGGCNNRPYCSDCGFPVADVCIPLSTTVSSYLCSNLLLFHLLTSKSKWLQYIYSIYVFKNQLFFIISRTSVDFVGWILWMRIEDHLKEKLWLNTGHLNKLLWILVN